MRFGSSFAAQRPSAHAPSPSMPRSSGTKPSTAPPSPARGSAVPSTDDVVGVIDVVAFAPHPDDVELFCGGTMLVAAAQGLSTAIVDMSDGELSTNGDAA